MLRPAIGLGKCAESILILSPPKHPRNYFF